MATRVLSRGKLTRMINRLIYQGKHGELEKTIRRNIRLTYGCLPYLANEEYRDMVLKILKKADGSVH